MGHHQYIAETCQIFTGTAVATKKVKDFDLRPVPSYWGNKMGLMLANTLAQPFDRPAAGEFDLGGTVSRLLQGAASQSGRTDGLESDLIRHLLAIASTAEQRLAEQQNRIAQLEVMSTTDELTGLLNRRGFDAQLRQTLLHADRHGDSGVLAYVDIDSFKSINDAYGHEAGDAVLRHVAALLIGSLRNTDIVARLHGDEFALVLLRADVDQALKRVERVEHTINSGGLLYRGNGIRLRASFGVAAFGAGADADELVRMADQGMYAKKRARQTTQMFSRR